VNARIRVAFAATLVAASAVIGVPVSLPGGLGVPAAEAAGASASVTATRVFVDADGTEKQVSSHDVTLHVSETENLRGRQEVRVTWEGAHPTGGVVSDPNSASGRLQEYPFVLLECRGVDRAGDLAAGQERLTPETCWTQTAAERYFPDDGLGVPPWRSDRYAAADDRDAIVGAPAIRPPSCPRRLPPAERWLPLRAADGSVYYGGPSPGLGCISTAPESDESGAGGLPTNTVYGITGRDGRGSAQFAVWTKDENATLGCSAAVDCALVAVPVVGISCDAFGTALPAERRLSETKAASADAACRAPDRYDAGQSLGVEAANPAVAGSMWWSASNWRNRITVPLHFAATGDVCNVVGGAEPQALFGSVALNELTASWQPKFCTDTSLFAFNHVQSADGAARNLLDSGDIDAALGTAPRSGGYTRPVARAPLTLTGWAIGYAVDGADGRPYDDLRLNARLIAKLLSQSYSALPVIKDDHPGLRGNPLNLLADPEFTALNPGLPSSSVVEAEATLQSLATDADLTWALTRYLDADPDARAWMDGEADPWGMKVNPAYRGIELPVESWPLLDNWPLDDQAALDKITSSPVNICYNRSPAPYLSLVANPVANVGTILQNLQYAVSGARTRCNADDAGDLSQLALKQQGRQQVGHRFVLGIVPLSAVHRYSLRAARLETAADTFVAPDDAGLDAAAALLRPDETAADWELAYDDLATTGKAAYPGAMPVYADVPTSGLPAAPARRLQKLLCYAMTDGQARGSANGQLPDGYLPLSSEHGLGALRARTLNVAAVVAAQSGQLPALDAAAPTVKSACAAPKKVPEAKPGGTKAPVAEAGPALVQPPAAAPATGPGAAAPAAAPEVVDAAVVPTAGEYSPFGSYGVLTLPLLVLLAALAGVVVRWSAEIRGLARGARRLVLRKAAS
jgi:hypothetical protein